MVSQRPSLHPAAICSDGVAGRPWVALGTTVRKAFRSSPDSNTPKTWVVRARGSVVEAAMHIHRLRHNPLDQAAGLRAFGHHGRRNNRGFRRRRLGDRLQRPVCTHVKKARQRRSGLHILVGGKE